MYNRCYVVFLQKLALQYYCTPIYVHFYKSDVECRDQACSQEQLRDQNDDFIYELYQVDYVQALLLFTVIYYEVDGT